MSDSWTERFHHGDRLALSRVLTFASHGDHPSLVRSLLRSSAKQSRVVAVTGSPGVGKSTLIGRLIEVLRKNQMKVAVVACDPQSPLSGGALLGDRFRMPDYSADPGVFIRSLSAASGHGAVAEHVGSIIRLLEVFGFDVVLVETVGAGQGDTAVFNLVDVLLLLLQPQTGDDLQWEKAGLLEVADIIAIHKSDLPQAQLVEADVQAMLGLAGGRAIPVVRVSSKTGEGLDDLWSRISALPLRRQTSSDAAYDLLHQAQQSLADWFRRQRAVPASEINRLVAGWQAGELGDTAALQSLLRLFSAEQMP